MTGNVSTIKMDYVFQVSDLLNSAGNISMLLAVLATGISLRIICNFIKMSFIYDPLLLILGFFGGLILHFQKDWDIFNFYYLANMNANNYLMIFFPVMLFHTAFSMDYHGFSHATLQVLLISIIGFPTQAAMLTVILGFFNDWSWEVAIIFSIICGIIETDIVFFELNTTQARVKHLQLLLQGEQLGSLATATFCFTVAFEYYFGSHETFSYIFLTLVWHLLGCLFGIIFGLILGYIFIQISNDMPLAVTLTTFAAFFSFFIAHIYIHQAGVIATIATGVMLSPTKIKTTSEVETHVNNYWDWLFYIFHTVAFVIPAIIIGLNPIYLASPQAYVYVLIIYLITFFTRCLLFAVGRPLLLRTGHSMSWGNLFIQIIGPYRGARALLISLLYRQYNPEIGQQVLTYVGLLCFLSSLLNDFSLRVVLRLLGMFDLTHARAANMRNAIDNIKECRNKAILSLKMDRVVADANWMVVEESTKISEHKMTEEGLKESYETRRAICTDCDLETVVLPTQKELREMEIEAKHRVLKAQLVSLWRQYETGTLSKSSMRVLSTLIQNTMEKEDPRMDVNELELFWTPPKYINKIKAFLEFILRILPQKYDFSPLKRTRAILFRITNTLTYKMIMTFLVVIDTYFILNLALHAYWPPVANISPEVLQTFDFIFYAIFLVEFGLLMFILGRHQYFSRQFNKLDFTCNVLIRTCEILMVIQLCIRKGEYINLQTDALFIINYTKLMLVIRLNRLYTVTELVVWKLLHVLENRLDNTLVQYYDIGKAFLVANDRTLKYLRHIAQDKIIYTKLRKELEDDRKRVSRSIGIIQKERPNVAVTIKTKHAIKQVINEMNDSVNDIYDEGLLDDIEKKYLKDLLENARKVWRSMKVITPCSPEYILKDVTWLFQEEETASFLLEHARLVSYSYQDIIIEVGDDPSGIFVLVSGLVKCVYRPSRSTIDNCRKHGALPNCDFLVNLKLEETQEDYIVCGNVIGEIGAVTGRRYDMCVICESAVQVYYIPWLFVHQVLFEMDSSVSVFCKVWKSIGIKIALIIFQYVPTFQGWLREKTLLYLEKSFVPILIGIEELFLNELVSDVVLIEGMVMDGNTRSIFYAPFYIPKTTNKLILPGTSKWSIDPKYSTRLLIIPNKHAEEVDIMGPGGIIKDTEELAGMPFYNTESSLTLPTIRRTTQTLRSRQKQLAEKMMYLKDVSSHHFHLHEVTSSPLHKEIQTTDSFSTDSEVSKLKIFQIHVRNVLAVKTELRVRKKNDFNCIEDVVEQTDSNGNKALEIFDFIQYSKLIRKRMKKKYQKRRENELDLETQTDVTFEEPVQIQLHK